ncbi:hypothetical protein ACFX5E_15985 [Flavobacterium sp. LS2P90]|uniref:Lipoprotein n=1 Tax=Flavobacterium xylosi TaxID=3230415 RepID=A0ABW6I0R2_9FLAO
MKNYIYLSFCLLFISCSSSRNIELQVVNDFIDEEFLGQGATKILIKESTTRRIPLEYYEKAFLDKDNPEDVTKVRIEPVGKRPFNWPIDSAEIKSLKDKNINDTIPYKWSKKDIRSKSIKILDKKEMRPYFIILHKGTEHLAAIIELSKPLVTSNGKFALINYSYFPFSLREGMNTVILMENTSGKWKKIGMYRVATY